MRGLILLVGYCYLSTNVESIYFKTDFKFYVRYNISEPLDIDQLQQELATSKQTPENVFLYTHGWFTHSLKKSGALGIKDDVLKNMQDVDIVGIVNWKLTSMAINYFHLAKSTIHLVAKDVAYLVEYLHDRHNIKPADTTLSGHSLGAHVMGLAARRVKDQLKIGEIGEIIALDPAGIGYGGTNPYDGLKKGDAKHIEVINTSRRYGMYGSVGDENIYLNAYNNDRLRACNRQFRNELCNHRAATDIFQDRLKGVNSLAPLDLDGSHIETLHILVLDVSQSMEDYGRKAAMISAATNVCQNLKLNSSVSIIIFGGIAITTLEPTIITDEKIKETVVAALPPQRRLISGSSIGAGLQQAYKIMDKSCTRDNNIVLLTDGEENKSPLIADVQPPKVSCYAVSSIAVGASADSKLEVLSAQSGGKVSSVSDLSNIKEQLLNAMQSLVLENPFSSTSTSQLRLPRKIVQFDETTYFNVDSDMTYDLQFFIDTSAYLKVSPKILSPDGVNYGHKCVADASSGGFRCQIGCFGKAGEWKVTLSKITEPRNEQASVEKDIKIFVTAAPPPTTSVLHLAAKLSSYEINYDTADGSMVSVEAFLVRGEYVVVGANVTATIVAPDGSHTNLQLADNGMGSDFEKNDGVYSKYLSTVNLKKNLRYQVYVTATSLNGTSRFRPKDTYTFERLDIDTSWNQTFNFQRLAIAGSIKAIRNYRELPPSRVKDLKVVELNSPESWMKLTWTSVGNNLDAGTAQEYQIMATCDQDQALLGHFSTPLSACEKKGNRTFEGFIAKEPGTKDLTCVTIPKALIENCNNSFSLLVSIRYANSDGLFGPFSNVASAINLFKDDSKKDEESIPILIYLVSLLGFVAIVLLSLFLCKHREYLYSKVSTRIF